MAEVVGHQLQTKLSWTGRRIDVEEIESELARLRYQAAGEPEGGETWALRTSLLNLVVYAEDDESGREAAQVIARLSGHHPSRALILIAKPSDADSTIEAELAAHCHRAQGMEQRVCCEEVTLRVDGRAARHLHSVIIPLLVPDLPVYVWWTGPLPEDPHVAEELAEVADRFIVDSAAFEDQMDGLLKLANLNSRLDCSLGDLNWERLEPWRQLLARYCELTGFRAYLDRLTSVKLNFSGGRKRACSSQVVLLLGWLAALFGWEVAGARRAPEGTAILRHAEQDISVEMRSKVYPGLEPGWIVSTTLRAPADGNEATLSLSRFGDPLHLVINLRDRSSVWEEHVLIEACDLESMLVKQLDAPRRDPEYVEALRHVLPIVEALKSGR
jgi:glucose-6-phosphate dehydrogenase assembly protein OpcA